MLLRGLLRGNNGIGGDEKVEVFGVVKVTEPGVNNGRVIPEVAAQEVLLVENAAKFGSIVVMEVVVDGKTGAVLHNHLGACVELGSLLVLEGNVVAPLTSLDNVKAFREVADDDVNGVGSSTGIGLTHDVVIGAKVCKASLHADREKFMPFILVDDEVKSVAEVDWLVHIGNQSDHRRKQCHPQA